MEVNSTAPSIVLMLFLKQNHAYNNRNWGEEKREKKTENIIMKNIGNGKVIPNIFKTLETIKRCESKAWEQTIIKQKAQLTLCIILAYRKKYLNAPK